MALSALRPASKRSVKNARCEQLLDDAAAAVNGFSGAQVREAAYLAPQQAVLRDDSGAELLWTPMS